MMENFNKIINNKSLKKVGSWTVIQSKKFLKWFVLTIFMGLFAHLTFLDCNFINIDFRHEFISATSQTVILF
jgi:hypothetical protein